MHVRLRRMTRADLPVLARWLREPLVAEWWHEDPTQVAARYGPAIDGDDPTRLRIALADGRPAGFVQWYRFADEPAYAAELAPFLRIPDEAWSLDHLIGEPDLRGRGAATAMIRAALAELGRVPLVVPVHARNRASVRALLRNGLRPAGGAALEPDNPAHSRQHVVLVQP